MLRSSAVAPGFDQRFFDPDEGKEGPSLIVTPATPPSRISVFRANAQNGQRNAIVKTLQKNGINLPRQQA
jgi:hypothetical protein